MGVEFDGHMTSIETMITLAKSFSSVVELSKDTSDRFMISIRHVSYKENKEDPMARGICGRGESVEEACSDFLSQAKGRILFGDSTGFYGKNHPEFICL